MYFISVSIGLESLSLELAKNNFVEYLAVVGMG